VPAHFSGGVCHIKNKGHGGIVSMGAWEPECRVRGFARLPWTCVSFSGRIGFNGPVYMIARWCSSFAGTSMRGRVMSVYNVAFRGGMPIGSLIGGTWWQLCRFHRLWSINGVLRSCLGL